MAKTAPKNPENGELVENEIEDKKPQVSDTKVSDAKAAISDLMLKNFSSFSKNNSTLRSTKNKADLFATYIKYLRENGKGDILEQLCAQLGVKEISIEMIQDITLDAEESIDTLFSNRMKDQQDTRKFYGLACSYVNEYAKALKKQKVPIALQKSFEGITTKVKSGEYTSFEDVLKLCTDWMQKHANKLNDNQKKALKKVFVGGAREVRNTLSELGSISKEEQEYIDETGLIQQGSVFQRTMSDMLNLYATSKLYNQFDTYEKNTDKLIKSFANPSLQNRISRYPADGDSLCAVMPSLRETLDSDASDDVKLNARQQALIISISADDEKLASLLEAVRKSHGNISTLSTEQQQAYVNYLKDDWKNSPEIEPFKQMLESKEIGFDKETYTKVIDQLFDLSSDRLEVKTKFGDVMTLHLKKHIANHTWSSDDLIENMCSPFPIVYELDGNQWIDPQTGKLDGKTYELLGQTDKKNSFELQDSEGKSLTIQHGNKANLKNIETNALIEGAYIHKDANDHIIAYKSPADFARHQNGEDLGPMDKLQVVEVTPSLIVDGAKENTLSSFMTVIAANKISAEISDKDALENEDAFAADRLKDKLEKFEERGAKNNDKKQGDSVTEARHHIEDVVEESAIEAGKPFTRKTSYLSRAEILSNGNLSDDQRISTALKLINANEAEDDKRLHNFTDAQKQALLDSHYSTRHDTPLENTMFDGKYHWERGRDKSRTAGYFNYTDEQLKEKISILKKGGFESWQIKLLLEDGLCGNSPQEQFDDVKNQLEEQKKKVVDMENDLRQKKISGVSPAGKTVGELGKECEYLDTQVRSLDDAIKNARKDMTVSGITAQEKDDLKKWIDTWDSEKKDLVARKHTFAEHLKEMKESFAADEKALKNEEKKRDDIQKEYDKKKKEVELVKNVPVSVSDFDSLSFDEQKARVDKIVQEYELEKDALIEQKKAVDDRLLMTLDLSEDEREALRRNQKSLANEIKDVDTKILQVKERLKEAQKKQSDSKEKKEGNENSESYKMLQSWKAIQGDTFSEDKVTFGLRAGSELFVSDGAGSNLLGGGKQWIRLVVQPSTNINEGRIVLKAYGVSGSLKTTDGGDMEGKEITIEGQDRWSEFINEWNDIAKMREPDSSMKSRGERIKGDQLSFKHNKKIEDWYKQLIKTVDFGTMKKQSEDGKGNKEDIKYFGSSFYDLDENSEKYVEKKAWYKVEFVGNKVKMSVPNPSGSGDALWKKELNMNEFLMFSADKNLKPYSQKDVDEVNAKNEGDEAAPGQSLIHDGVVPSFQDPERMKAIGKRGLFGWKWRSIGAFKKSRKNIIEAVNKKVKEKEKENEDALWGDMLGSALFKKIEKAGIPTVSAAFEDLRAGLESKWDQEKMKKIDEFAGEPDKNKDTTPAGPTAYIEALLFGDGKANEKKPLHEITGTKEAYKEPLRAAGYYQYALSKDGPYYRSLAKYKGSGLWVRFILGEGMQKQYLKWRKKVELAYEKNPNDPTIKNQYVFDEAWFMSKIVQNKEYDDELVDKELKDAVEKQIQTVFPKGWLGGLVDKAEAGYLNSSKLEEAAKTKEYANFQSLYTYDFWGAIEKKGAHVGIGMLQGMADKVKKDENAWKQRSLGMLYPILSGQLDDSVVEGGVKGFYLGLARKYSFPLGLYSVSGDKYGREELVDLLSIFEKASGKKPEPSIRSIVAGVNPRDYESFSKALRPWWDGMKDHVLDYTTNPSKLFSLEKKIRENADGEWGSEQEKLNKLAIVKDFIDKKIQDTEETGDFSSAKGDSIILKKNLWSISKSASRSHLWNMSPDYSKFKEKTVEYAPGLWQELRKKLDTFYNEDLTAREIAHLFNRYFAINNPISGILGSESKTYLMQAIALGSGGLAPIGKDNNNAPAVQLGQKDLMKRAIIGTVDTKGRNGENIHPDVYAVLELWQKIFLKPEVRERLSSVLNDIPELKDYDKKFNAWKNDPQKVVGELQEKNKNKKANEIRKQFGEGGTSTYDDDDDEDDYLSRIAA